MGWGSSILIVIFREQRFWRGPSSHWCLRWPLWTKARNYKGRSLWSLFIIHLFSFTMFQRGEINYKCLKICMKLNVYQRHPTQRQRRCHSGRRGAAWCFSEKSDDEISWRMEHTWVAHQIERPAVGCLWPASTGLHPLGVDCPTRKPIAIRPEPLTFF